MRRKQSKGNKGLQADIGNICDGKVSLLCRENNLATDTVQPCDTNQARSDSDFGVKVSTIQFYAIEHHFKSNRWIELKLYQKIPEVFFYDGVHFQENPHSERTCNIGPNRIYEFCYLLPFDLWTSYLAKILFLQGCGSLFWEFPSSTRIFNELHYNLQVW